ncbi:MAG TPA: hypothetical protein VND41_00370 [Nitrososphaerales archaeon]|nr:hypothetical protein [Nitrososphaerales archaeon]
MQQTQDLAAWTSGRSLKNLRRIAGASLMLAGVLFVWAFVAQFILPPPGLTTESLLQYIAEYRSFFIISYALFTAANSLSIVGALGIYVVTRVWDRSYAILGGGTLVVGFTVVLLSSTAPALIKLSDAYSASADVVNQQALAIAAEAVASTNNPLVASSFIGVGVIFVSLAMLKGVYGKGLPYLGFFVGALNIVRGLPPLAAYSLVTATFVAVSSVWICWVGRRIYREG